jgi:ribosomal protein S18 acetylase RimI-like enzyme
VNDEQYTVRKARLDDLEAIKAIADSNRRELGFVRRAALSEGILRSEVYVGELGTELVGFVEYHHRRDGQTTLYHIAVAAKHRMQCVGKKLMQTLASEAIGCGKRRLVLKCPAELPANGFYQKLGFAILDIEEGKRRFLNVWSLSLRMESLTHGTWR